MCVARKFEVRKFGDFALVMSMVVMLCLRPQLGSNSADKEIGDPKGTVKGIL